MNDDGFLIWPTMPFMAELASSGKPLFRRLASQCSPIAVFIGTVLSHMELAVSLGIMHRAST